MEQFKWCNVELLYKAVAVFADFVVLMYVFITK